jgi:hypothetical protein
VPLDSGRFPVFHVRGHLLPLVPRVASNAQLFPGPSPESPLTLLLPCPRPGDSHRAVVRRYRQPAQEMSYHFSGAALTVTLSAHPRTVTLRVTGLAAAPVALSALSGRSLRWSLEAPAALTVEIDCTLGERLKITF